MKNNINKKMGATLLAAAIMAGTAVIPMSNAAVEAAATKAARATNKPSIEYRTQVQDYAWMPWVSEGEISGTVSEEKRMETLQVRMLNCEGVSLKFYAHIQDLGDMWFTDKDEYVGTVAQEKRVEAIAITSEGLKEKGYKLQYRVQVQDYGWLDWVDDGELAGVRFEGKRLETIQIVVVPVDDELALEKAIAVDTLTSYDASLKATQGANYDGIHATIEAAKQAIMDATTAEEVAKQFDAIVAEIKRIDSDIEENAEINAKETEEAKVEARANVAAYRTAVAQTTGLTSTDRDIINQILDNASKAIENAITKVDVETEDGDLTRIIEASYNDVALLKEQNQAIAELNTYLPNASQGVIDVINKAISNIREDVLPGDVRTELSTAIAAINPLKEAQEEYLNELSVYRSAVNASDVSNKTILINAIRRTETNIKNAKSKDEADALISDFRTEFSDFEDKANEILFIEAVDKAIATLTPYTSYISDKDKFVDGNDDGVNDYVTVKKLAEDTIESLNSMKEAGYLKGANDAESVNTLVGEKANPDATPAVAGSGVIKELEDKIEAVVLSEKEAREAYQTAYNIAMDALNKYEETVRGLELTEVQKADINTMISNTRTKVGSVSDATEVAKAMSLLDSYMSKYCGADSASEIQANLIKKAQENACALLAEYQNSTISSIRTEATTDIQAIKNGSFADYTAVNNALDIYKNTLDVKIAQFNATEKLLQYRSQAGKVAEDKTITAYVDEMLAIINGAECTPAVSGETVATLKEKLAKVETTLTTATTTIKGALGVTAESEAKALQDAREAAYAVVNKYMALASEIRNTELVSDLADFNAEIRKETNIATINAMVAANGDVENYIEKYYNVFYTQYEAINATTSTISVNSESVKPLAKILDDKKEEADFAKYQAIVAEAEANIKDLSKMTKDDADEYAYIARMLKEASAKVAELDAKVAVVNAYKLERVNALKALEDANTNVTAQENIYIEKVNAISLDDCTIVKSTDEHGAVTYTVTKCSKIDAIMKEAGDAFGKVYDEGAFVDAQ